jgi:hypothetical protein
LLLTPCLSIVTCGTMTSLSPSSGLPGTQVTIGGSGFGASQGGGTVWVGRSNATLSSWSDTKIVATVVAGLRTGDAYVFKNGVDSNGFPFYILPATITGVTPSTGVPGTQATINGSLGIQQQTEILLYP